MGAFDDAKSLVDHAEKKLPKILEGYNKSLQAQSISSVLLVEIKNFLENLRSALDFAAYAVFDQYGSSRSSKPKVYFPYATRNQIRSAFEQSGRIEACIPGLAANRPDIVQVLIEMQHFGSHGYTWLPAFMKLTNENKHQRLTPQIRKEKKELRISSGGAAMSIGQGASISIGHDATVSIGEATIHGGQSFDVNRPPRVEGGKVEVITWVSFHFDSNDQPVVPLLQAAIKGVREMVAELSTK